MAKHAPEAVPDKLQPHNVEAEEAVLGSLLIDPDAILHVATFLTPDDFYVERHSWIYETIQTLHERREPADLVTLSDELERRGQLREMGGPAYLSSLINATPTSIHAEFYARIIERTAVLRRLIDAAGQIARLAYQDTEDSEEVVDRAEEIIFNVSARRTDRDLRPIRQVLDKFYDRIEYLHQHQGEIIGIPTGLADLDKLLGGLQRSDMVVMAGRPGMGKCVSADTKLVDPETGRLVRIETLVEQRQAHLLTLNRAAKLEPAQAIDFVDDGHKPVYRVRTTSGREIKVTLPHPFLTGKGWRPLSDLTVGDVIAVPGHIPVFGQAAPPAYQVEQLAYLLAGGGLNGSVTGRLQMPGGDAKSEPAQTMPDCVYQYTRSRLALFLNRFFAGAVSDRGAISCHVVSKSLAHGLQHLLLRFGIIARLQRNRPLSVTGRMRPAYEVRITGRENLARFTAEIGLLATAPGPDKINRATDLRPDARRPDTIFTGDEQPLQDGPGPLTGPSDEKYDGDRRPVTGDRIFRGGREMASPAPANRRAGKHAPARFPSTPVGRAATAPHDLEGGPEDVYWEPITHIEYVGEQQVYDLTVPQTHNFVADDMIVHNTSLALSVALQAARRWLKRVAIFSLEMSDEQVVQRLVSAETGIDSQRLRLGAIKEDEWPTFIQATSLLGNAPIFIDDTPAISALELRSKARRLHAEHGLDLLIVDYLQLMRGDYRSENRQQEISFISRSIKGLARELNVPILALSQLSRQVESRHDKRPMLSDLRESGCLTGETLIERPGAGRGVPLRELIGHSGFEVIGFNPETGRLEPALVSRAFATGLKPVYRLTTQPGRTIRATANHKFLTRRGWLRLDQLRTGDDIALPHRRTRSIYWNKVASIEAAGRAEVFDLTVPRLHNFIANDMVVHNSIEQDADVVLFIYRDEVYNPDTEFPNIAEIIVSKHRSGPTGIFSVYFKKQLAQFVDLEVRTQPLDY